jgi:hypothetical protein
MSCHGGTHFSCECQRELLDDALDALASIVAGVDKYEKALAPYDKIAFRRFFHAIPSARSVLRRHRRHK